MDKHSILLGGFRRSKDYVIDRKLPILGSLLPFLFSRKITTRETKEIFIVLTPYVIDLTPQPLDEKLKGLLEPEKESLKKD